MLHQDKNPRSSQSTGPRSANGKENSSRNATTHGLSCKKFFLIPGESEEEFLTHAQSWFDVYKDHASPALQLLLQDLVEAHWMQRRAASRIFESESALATAEINRDPLSDEIFRRLRNMQRYKTSYENSFQRALRAVEAFCKNRTAEHIAQSRQEQIELSIFARNLKCLALFVKACQLTHEDAKEATRMFFATNSSKPENESPTTTPPSS